MRIIVPSLLPYEYIHLAEKDIPFITKVVGSSDIIVANPLLVHPRRLLMDITIEDYAYSIDHYLKKFNKSKIVFFDGPESFEPYFCRYVFQTIMLLLKQYGFSKKHFQIITGAEPLRANLDSYKTICERNKWPTIPITLYNHFEHRWSNYLKVNPLNTVHAKKKQKHFLFLNGQERVHRTYLLACLIKQGLLDNCFYSFYGQWKETTLRAKRFNSISKKVAHYITEEHIPKKLTIDNYVTDKAMQHIVSEADKRYHDQTYFSLITETCFFNRVDVDNINDHNHLDSIFLTEKTFRAIACKHPFIIASRPNILKALREKGYRTFSPFIDESYDDIGEDFARLDKIIKTIADLCSKNQKFWDQFMTFSREVTEHNYQVLKSSGLITLSGFDIVPSAI